jgi:hypothetical protein
LFGVLENRSCKATQPGSCEGPLASHDAVALAGLDGYARVKTTLAPRSVPYVGNAQPVLQLEGQMASGGVFYVDGKGTVSRLDRASITSIATFPITGPQQEVAFAVSPDGTHLMATVLTFPDHHPSTDPNNPFGTFSGSFRLQLESAIAGGPTTTIKQWTSSANQVPDSPGGFDNFAVVAWDATGPIALVHATTGTQNAWLNNQRWFQGYLARLNSDGTLGPMIGPAGCLPYWRPVNGRFVCTRNQTQGNTAISLVDLAGKVLWTGAAPPGPGQISGDFAPSPDGSKLAMDGQIVSLNDNSVIRIAPNFEPQGWLTSDTLIGILFATGTIGILRLSDPQHPEDWGFRGAFVGMLR